MSARRKNSGEVIYIDKGVRQFLKLYATLFPTYSDAAAHVNINKDTLARYLTSAPNIDAAIFSALATEISVKFPAAEIKAALEGRSATEVAASARKRNGAQHDEVMIRLTAAVSAVLKEFAGRFPSRAAAAAALGVNPRTFKAYLHGQIRSIPRSSFWEAYESLLDGGWDEKAWFKRQGVNSIEDILEEIKRAKTLYVSRAKLMEMLAQVLDGKQAWRRDADLSLYNACRRYFGHPHLALVTAMEFWFEQVSNDIREEVKRGAYVPAQEKFDQIERYVQNYAKLIRRSSRSVRTGSRKDLRAGVEKYQSALVELRDLVRPSLAGDGAAGLGEAERYRLRYPGVKQVAEYDPKGTYHIGALILHPEFGPGRVLKEQAPGLAVVQFTGDVGRQVLRANIAPAAARGGPALSKVA